MQTHLCVGGTVQSTYVNAVEQPSHTNFLAAAPFGQVALDASQMLQETPLGHAAVGIHVRRVAHAVRPERDQE